MSSLYVKAFSTAQAGISPIWDVEYPVAPRQNQVLLFISSNFDISMLYTTVGLPINSHLHIYFLEDRVLKTMVKAQSTKKEGKAKGEAKVAPTRQGHKSGKEVMEKLF